MCTVSVSVEFWPLPLHRGRFVVVRPRCRLVTSLVFYLHTPVCFVLNRVLNKSRALETVRSLFVHSLCFVSESSFCSVCDGVWVCVCDVMCWPKYIHFGEMSIQDECIVTGEWCNNPVSSKVVYFPQVHMCCHLYIPYSWILTIENQYSVIRVIRKKFLWNRI